MKSNAMRFHIIGLPHTITNNLYLGCAFTGHIIRLSKGLLNNGHEVIHYGNWGSELECSEDVNVTSEDFVKEYIGDFKDKALHNGMYGDKHLDPEQSKTFHLSVATEIRKRVKKDDYIIFNYGTFIPEMMPFIEDLHSKPVFIVESTIGYLDSWVAPYKIFESESVRAWNRSQWNQNLRHLEEQQTEGVDYDNLPRYAVHECTPQFTDDTIHTFCDPDLFDFKKDKQDYFAYVGRFIESKGLNLAVDVCERLGEKLVVAGHGDLLSAIGRDRLPSCVEFVGYADVEKRREIMSNAKGGWVCTYYSEHGGNVIHEYGLSGTPVICTNWGSFTHSVLHKKTGYLIQDGAEAEWAAKNIGLIKPYDCRKWQMNYTIERAIPKFERYFERINNIWYNGNNAFESYEVKNLDHREMIYPDDPRYDMNLKKLKSGKNVQNRTNAEGTSTEKSETSVST